MSPTSHHSSGAARQPERPVKTAWSYDQFYSALHRFGHIRSAPQRYPDAIDLTPLAPVLRRLSSLARTAPVEVGRYGIVDALKNMLIVKARQNGSSNSILIKGSFALHEKPVLLFHTHPAKQGAQHQMEHFSEPDFRSFLSSPVMGSVVSTEGSALMLLKTELSKIPASSSGVERQIQDAFRDAEKNARQLSRRQTGDVARIATKMLCMELGLSFFYLPVPPTGDLIAKKVELFPS